MINKLLNCNHSLDYQSGKDDNVMLILRLSLTVKTCTGKLLYNEPGYNKSSEQRLVLEATYTAGSSLANLNFTNCSL